MNICNLNRNVMIVLTVIFLAFASRGVFAEVVVLGHQNFESGAIPNTSTWGFGAQDGGKLIVSTDRAENYNGSAGSLKGSYPAPSGGMYVWGGFDVAALNIDDVYVEFWAKMPNAKHGLKFLKVFGQRVDKANSLISTANTTFGLDYTGVDYGSMYYVGFGDGTTEQNDTQNALFFTGESPAWVGRSYGKAIVSTPQKVLWSSKNWSNSWHHFRFRVKFNSGTTSANQVADGAYYVEIDGKVYLDAKNIFNRHYLNKPIQKISFFDWSQGGKSAFDIWYDDIKITTGGFDDSKPAPPTQPQLIIK